MNSNRLDRATVRAIACACVAVHVLVLSATSAFSADSPTNGRRTTAMAPAEKKIKSWHYQLQDINPSAIAKSSADMIVIDYSGENGPFTKAQVERMKRKPDGSRRIVIAYMSIGEAETYRWYWPQHSSTWLGPENPEWRGNYGVRFWLPDWQAIIFEYTDRIIAAGFDGVYLDKVDEFEEMGHEDEMVEFVTRISAQSEIPAPRLPDRLAEWRRAHLRPEVSPRDRRLCP